jgi:hypothetical protein
MEWFAIILCQGPYKCQSFIHAYLHRSRPFCIHLSFVAPSALTCARLRVTRLRMRLCKGALSIINCFFFAALYTHSGCLSSSEFLVARAVFRCSKEGLFHTLFFPEVCCCCTSSSVRNCSASMSASLVARPFHSLRQQRQIVRRVFQLRIYTPRS